MSVKLEHLFSAVRPGPRGDQLSKSTIFDLLQNKRRRYAFHYLRQRGETATLADLADHVAAWENDTTVHDVDTEARQRVYISLFQTHLPRMDSAGVLEFDKETGTVRLSEAASTIEIYLEAVPKQEILWAHYYLGLTAMGGVFLAFVLFDVRPFSDYQLAVWFFILTLFSVSAILHHLYLRRRRLGTEGPPPTEL